MKIFREDYTDLSWFEKMKQLGENLPNEYCDIFDREGEIAEEYLDIMTPDMYIVKTTTGNNKLIAEFMGLEPVKAYGKYSISKDHCTSRCDTIEETKGGFGSIAKYHTSWDWLIPVVKETHKYMQGSDCDKNIEAAMYGLDIDEVYKAVIEFIKWYNENKN